jgi:hypothetical protein
MMKSLKQIIIMFALVIGLALSVSAQTDDQKRPPKVPPVRDPTPKGTPPKNNPPRGDDRPKKPGMSLYLVSAYRDRSIG